ncbi:Hypothetical protein R9X50_00396500 [Acrodontium crateriforme]|uniref:Glutathione S-transferase kappa n=1 Tax=Acrodontium crateriforme TaxID=150365 RepID=A0AAQ3M589_9PEZI|nr:Hypothetical protein R9X50_00396500 [Acrodontium crateriforme]
MPRPKLTLYLDVVSPFAYIAWYATKNSPVFKQCDVELIPVFLGGIMQKCNNRPPIEIINKDKYVNMERARWTKAFKVPMSGKTPEPFPQLTLNAMRAMVAVWRDTPEKLDTCFNEMFKIFWGELKPISKDEVWQEALRNALGAAEAEKFVKLSKTPEIKKLLLETTDRAFKDGAFGLPYYMATNDKGETEGFWGISHLGLAVEHMGLDRRADPGPFRALL